MNKEAILNIVAPNKTDAIIVNACNGVPIEVQNFIRQNLNTDLASDYLKFFQAAFNDPSLERRDKQDRYESAKAYVIKLKRGSEWYNFTDSEITRIFELAEHRLPSEIINTLFPTLDNQGEINKRSAAAKKLSSAVGLTYRGEMPIVSNLNALAEGDYIPPQTDEIVIKKINEADPNARYVKSTLSAVEKTCVRFLRFHLNDKMFVLKANSYRRAHERDLFEQQFIKSVYNKPDMIADDINAAISLSQAYVREIQISELINILDDRLKTSLEGDAKASMIFTEELKSKTAELAKCQTFITTKQTQLNNSRSKRLDTESRYNQSLAPYIVKVADQNYRQALVRAKRLYEDTSLTNEIKKLSELPEDIGEIHGIDIDEVLGFKHDIME